MKSCSPCGRAASVKFDSSVLNDFFFFLLVSARSSWSDVGVERVCLVVGEVDAGILKVIRLLRLSLIRQALHKKNCFQLHIFHERVFHLNSAFSQRVCIQDRKVQSNSSCGNNGTSPTCCCMSERAGKGIYKERTKSRKASGCTRNLVHPRQDDNQGD